MEIKKYKSKSLSDEIVFMPAHPDSDDRGYIFVSDTRLLKDLTEEIKKYTSPVYSNKRISIYFKFQ